MSLDNWIITKNDLGVLGFTCSKRSAPASVAGGPLTKGTHPKSFQSLVALV